MRSARKLFLLAAFFATGCHSGPKPMPVRQVVRSQPAQVQAAPKKQEKVIITPSDVRRGAVVRVNETSRYVIVSFPAGLVPANGRVAGVYRKGLKVGLVRITGPQQGENTAADIAEGEVAEGDEVRAN